MNPINWKHGLGALLICVGVGACDQQTTSREEAQAPMTAPEATTTAPVDTGTPQTDPYASTPPVATPPMDEGASMTDSTDISGTETTGDTLGDRCASFTGEALTECLEMESARRQDVQPPTLQDADEMPPQDVPQQ